MEWVWTLCVFGGGVSGEVDIGGLGGSGGSGAERMYNIRMGTGIELADVIIQRFYQKMVRVRIVSKGLCLRY